MSDRPSGVSRWVRSLFGGSDEPPSFPGVASRTTGTRTLLSTEGRVFLVTSSSTGVWEAAIRNCVRDRVLCCMQGAFSDRPVGHASPTAGCWELSKSGRYFSEQKWISSWTGGLASRSSFSSFFSRRTSATDRALLESNPSSSGGAIGSQEGDRAPGKGRFPWSHSPSIR